VTEQRFGLGFDVHRSGAGRPLFLGGVRFADEPGLLAHSDGDVVCHAMADALLGAAALGDIGEHFPDDDPSVEGMAGLDLLAQTVMKVEDGGWVPRSADVTVIGERPAVAPAREEMRRNLAATLRVPVERVSVKATRPEGLGLAGDGIGCIALAVLSSV
jgi:2-C-methyl-D-erythritol 2,4-cyclodiphosphate synthase